ncbi:MAG: sigma-54 dependent transcriptional regulator [Nannocystaceae bacterium]
MGEQHDGVRVLVVDDESAARSALTEMLRDEGYEVRSAADGFKALGKVEVWVPDVVITDVKMPALGGIELMGKLRERFPDIAVIVMTGFGSVEGAVEAMHLGADDYLSKPVHFPQLLMVLQRVLQHRRLQREAHALRDALRDEESTDEQRGIIGQSKPFRDLMDLVGQVADSPVAVMVLGETGTGKQFLARLLHGWSGRREKSLVVMKCGALDGPAFERELFGVEKDGALVREGRVADADGGTLFLDDIAEMPRNLQERLLSLLQERSYVPVGGETPRRADIRLITASNREFDHDVAAGRFLRDLYYRINVVTLRIPPLRERREDIPLLAMHFLRRSASRCAKEIVGFNERALGALLDHDWPGNVRQLEHAVEHAVVMCQANEIEPRDLPREIGARQGDDEAPPIIPGATLRDLERYAILRTLEHVGGSTSRAAKMLGISPRKIQYRLNEYRATPQSSVPAVAQMSDGK